MPRDTDVAHHTQLLKAAVDGVWLGGISTSAILVTVLATQDQVVNGLLLFSPAFGPKDAAYVLASIACKFFGLAGFYPSDANYTRYDTLALNGVALNAASVAELDKQLNKAPYDKPVLAVISEHDSVIDSAGVSGRFQQDFTHPTNRLLWYGNERIQNARVLSLNSALPQHRISTFSPVSVLFSHENPYSKKKRPTVL